jgi:hypothetical protein
MIFPQSEEAALATPSKEARERAELKFKKKEVEAREATKAMADYKAGLIAQREKTARLRALREAKQAADAAGRAADEAAAEVNADKMDAGKARDPVKRPSRKRVLAAERAE